MRKRLLWIGLALIALAVTLTVIYGEELREQLLRPLLYELWLWELRLESLPFALVWLVFLLVGSLGVYMTILDLLLHGRQHTLPQERVYRMGPIEALAHRIGLACQGELARWNVHRLIGDIAIRWVALRAETGEIEARRRFGEICPELHNALDLQFPRSATRRSWLWLSAHLPISPQQKRARLREISRLTEILESFAGEAYESTHSHR
jgi:hypothetical protein